MPIPRSKNPKTYALQEKQECVSCGNLVQGTAIGYLDDPGWIPCCNECYESGKIEEWMKEHNHSLKE